MLQLPAWIENGRSGQRFGLSTSADGRAVEGAENGPADGLLISKHDGKMYVTGPETNSIGVRDLSQKGMTPSILIQDDKLHWPDTFSEGPDGTIYSTTSHIQDSAFFKEGAPIALPTELWSFKPTP